jgi:small subunit ribosomal protein S13
MSSIQNIIISGVQMNMRNKIFVSLSDIFGIGFFIAKKICLKLKIDYNLKLSDLTIDEINLIRSEIESNLKVESELRKIIKLNIESKKLLNSYQGRRHFLKLPVHGQRTKTNARTRKGKKSTVANKKINKK